MKNLIKKLCSKLGICCDGTCETTKDIKQKDIRKLVNIYIQLKEIMALLKEIEDKYPHISGLADMIEKDIKQLDIIDHHLIAEAQKIKEQKDNEK